MTWNGETAPACQWGRFDHRLALDLDAAAEVFAAVETATAEHWRFVFGPGGCELVLNEDLLDPRGLPYA